ncbi:MAG: hypothetical protein LBK08_02045 [Treponema sp.]|jgi:hypothetical protein|nr:hypothetical protein [Treponema sp.]
MKKRILEKMFDVRANNQTLTKMIDDTQKPEFLASLFEAIKKYSKLLAKAQLVQGNFNQRYIFKIEDDSSVIQLLDGGNINTEMNITSGWECNTKALGLGIMVPALVDAFYDNNVNSIITNMLYKPFTKSIEANVICGDYLDKPLFSTTNTITGTKDFEGLLQLIRKLKDTYDDGCVVGNSGVISGIIDTIDKEAYLNEYLLNGTIEGIQIISKYDSPAEADGKFLIGFDPNKICLLLIPQLQVKKISVVGSVEKFFHIYGFCNGGDVFNSAIGLKE